MAASKDTISGQPDKRDTARDKSRVKPGESNPCESAVGAVIRKPISVWDRRRGGAGSSGPRLPFPSKLSLQLALSATFPPAFRIGGDLLVVVSAHTEHAAFEQPSRCGNAPDSGGASAEPRRAGGEPPRPLDRAEIAPAEAGASEPRRSRLGDGRSVEHIGFQRTCSVGAAKPRSAFFRTGLSCP